MGYFKSLLDQINGVAPKWAVIQSQIRGLPLYADPLLKGTSRFSRKTGNVGFVNPDIDMTLAADVNQNDTSISVTTILPYIIPNCVINLGNAERFIVNEITTSSFASPILTLNAPVQTTYDSGDQVQLYSVPILAAGEYAKGVTTIIVRTQNPMMIGDAISFQIYPNVFQDINVIGCSNLGLTNNEYPMTSELELDAGIPIAIATNQMIQLRAYPAYFSQITRVPRNPITNRSIGPFLIDYYGGKIVGGLSPQVFMTSQLFDTFQVPITDDPIAIQPNYPITQRSIFSDFLIFSDLMKGSFLLSGEGNLNATNTIAVFDTDGLFGCTFQLQPNWVPGNQWNVEVTSNANTTLRIGFEPNNFVNYTLVANVPQIIQVGLLHPDTVTTPNMNKLTIVGSSAPGAQLTFNDWELIGPEVDWLTFNILVRVTQKAQWLGSGMIIKPFFLSLDYIQAQYDNNQDYDSGLIGQ